MQTHCRIDDLAQLRDKARLFVAPACFATGVPEEVIEAAGIVLPVVASALLERKFEWNDGAETLAAGNSKIFSGYQLAVAQ